MVSSKFFDRDPALETGRLTDWMNRSELSYSICFAENSEQNPNILVDPGMEGAENASLNVVNNSGNMVIHK